MNALSCAQPDTPSCLFTIALLLYGSESEIPITILWSRYGQDRNKTATNEEAQTHREHGQAIAGYCIGSVMKTPMDGHTSQASAPKPGSSNVTVAADKRDCMEITEADIGLIQED